MLVAAASCATGPSATTPSATAPRAWDEHGAVGLEGGWRPPTEGVEYGEYPSKYEEIVKAWFAASLKDPESARYRRISIPRQEHAITNQFRREVVYGYSVCAAVNAKNSFGGYVGFQTTWILIRDGKVVRSQNPDWPIYIGRPTNCDDGPEPEAAAASTDGPVTKPALSPSP
jgi:hypothetical protein